MSARHLEPAEKQALEIVLRGVSAALALPLPADSPWARSLEGVRELLIAETGTESAEVVIPCVTCDEPAADIGDDGLPTCTTCQQRGGS